MIKTRLKFAKSDDLRWLSHLELSRAWHRLINRAALPIAYSQGFSPHPKIALSSALPVGVAGSAEYADLILTAPVASGEILNRINKVAPAGIATTRVREVPPETPTLGSSIKFADYRLAVPGQINIDNQQIAAATAGTDDANGMLVLNVETGDDLTIMVVRLPIESKLKQAVVSIGASVGIESDLFLVDRVAQWVIVNGSLVDPIDV